MWLAPNMVTLLGFLFIVANVFLIEIFMPDLLGPVSICSAPSSRQPLNYFSLGPLVVIF